MKPELQFPAEDVELPDFVYKGRVWEHVFACRFSGGKFTYREVGTTGWQAESQAQSRTFQDAWYDWLKEQIENIKPIDKPTEIAKMRGYMETIEKLSPDTEAMKAFVAGIK